MPLKDNSMVLMILRIPLITYKILRHSSAMELACVFLLALSRKSGGLRQA